MLLDLDDVIREEDIQAGGSCVNGCVRRLSNAVAAVEGQGDCDLVVQNLLDHRDTDVRAGTLNIVHVCTGADGDLKYQVNPRLPLSQSFIFDIERSHVVMIVLLEAPGRETSCHCCFVFSHRLSPEHVAPRSPTPSPPFSSH